MKIQHSLKFPRIGLAKMTMATGGLLIVLGFLAFYGATHSYPEQMTLLRDEVAWLLCGGMVGLLFYIRPLDSWLKLAPILYMISIAAIILAFLLPHEIYNQFVLPEVFFAHLTEWAALPVILLASHLLRDEKRVFLSRKTMNRILVVVGIPMALLFLWYENTIISAYMVMVIMALMAVNLRKLDRFLLIFITCGILIIYFYFTIPSYSYQKTLTYNFPPQPDPDPNRIHILNCFIFLRNSGLFGKGFGNGELSLLDGFGDLHRRFSFAFFGEQFGFIGVTLVLSLFFLLIINCLRITCHVDKREQCFIGTAVSWFLGWHIFMHIGAIFLLVPEIGFHLPFFPSGPSSVAFMPMLAIILRIMKHCEYNGRVS